MTTTTTITRNPAWMTLGAKIMDNTLDGKAALKAAGMNDWNVRKEPMFTESGIEVPNRVATVRTDPRTGRTEYLGYVGRGYTIHQNEEMVEFLEAVADASGAHFDTAGYTKNGAKTFVSMKLPEGIKIGGEDAHDLYLLATNGHDGFNAFQVSVVPIRLACTNQITMAVRNAKQSWKIRHTTHMAGRIDEARTSLELTFDYIDAFTEDLHRLLDTEFTEAEFDRLTRDLLPDGKTESATAKVQERRDEMMRLFVDADTNTYGRGTKYAAFNAITEYADWYAPVRGDKDGTRRAARIMEAGPVQEFKDTAHRLLVAA